MGDILAPQLEEIKGELKAVRSEIARLDSKIDNVDAKLTNQIENVDGKLTARIEAARVENQAHFEILGTRIDAVGKEVAHIREMIDVETRLVLLETRLQPHN